MSTFRAANGHMYEKTVCGPVLMADPADANRCCECGDLYWDEAALDHARDLEVCNSDICIQTRIRRMKTMIAEYEKALRDIAGANGKIQILSAPLAASLALQKGEDSK